MRVREIYLAGASTRDAVVEGLETSGPTITAAGCIMAIAFSGLIFSRTPCLNAWAFYLVRCSGA